MSAGDKRAARKAIRAAAEKKRRAEEGSVFAAIRDTLRMPYDTKEEVMKRLCIVVKDAVEAGVTSSIMDQMSRAAAPDRLLAESEASLAAAAPWRDPPIPPSGGGDGGRRGSGANGGGSAGGGGGGGGWITAGVVPRQNNPQASSLAEAPEAERADLEQLVNVLFDYEGAEDAAEFEEALREVLGHVDRSS